MSDLSSFTRFVLEHEQDDIYALRLAAGKYKDIDVKRACLTIECRRKIKDKVPSFYACPEFRYVAPLPAEQCSGEKTALFKAKVAAEILGGSRSSAWKIADLTGGMGVDAMAFSQVASEVLYNEMNGELAEATAFNFSLLGIGNVRFSSRRLIRVHAPASDAAMDGADATIVEILGDFEPDLIYLDPARRSDTGAKVFRLEDCSPNILELKDDLLARCPHLLLKLSPMADISAVCKSLGPRVGCVILVAGEGECKEMLVALDREHEGPYRIVVHEEDGEFSFFPEEEKALAPVLPPSLESLPSGSGLLSEDGLLFEDGLLSEDGLLFEPGKALMKSGAFKLIARRYGLYQLAPDTHIYAVPAGQEPPHGLGKCYRIVSREPMRSSSLESFKKNWPPMDVTARNIPLTSEALRQRLWGKNAKGNRQKPGEQAPATGEQAHSPGERYHLFALACEDAQGRQENTLFVTIPLRDC